MISEALKINCSLTTLWLSCDKKKERVETMVIKTIRMKWVDNSIEVEGTKMISEGLNSNSTLTELDLRGDEKEKKYCETMIIKKLQMKKK